MKKKDLLTLKKSLEEKQLKLENSLANLHRKKTRVDNPLSKSNEDDNTQICSADLLIDILDDLEFKEYNMVQKAISKISKGEYGVCEECENNIGIKRLAALPFAKLCITCAKELELEKN